MAYRNCYYEPKKGLIHLFTWDNDGKRTKIVTEFEPYIFIESQNGCDGTSIFNTPLKKIKFANSWDKNNFVKDTPITRIYHNLIPEQQFLLDTFKNDVDKPDYAQHPLKIFYIDIETYSSATGKFSTPEEAVDPINLITVFDSLSEKFTTFGCKNFATQEENVTYVKCATEKELLNSFLKFWRKDFPDIVSGWNCHGYDIPYIINRMNRVFDDEGEKSKKLSPVNRLYLKEKASVNKLGRAIDRWIISGISILDYMDVYQTFSLGDRESYSLNYIGEYELGEGKTAIGSGSLSRLADTDWMKFVDYNIQDVRLLVMLEEKLKYLRLIRNLSYRGFVSFEKATAKVSLITGVVAYQAMTQRLYIPTFNEERVKTNFEGGYVRQPNPSIYKDVVTYDANSLYPNTIITLNISPETKVGKIIDAEDDKIKVRFTNDKIASFTKDKFKIFVEDQKLSISKANVIYTQKFKGVVPNLIDKLYNERVEAKNRMLECKKAIAKEKDLNQIKKLKEEAIDNDTLSNVYKVLLNSVYGVFSQIYSPLFDIDHAESVTLTGQAVAKQGADLFFEYAKNDGFIGEYDDLIKYSDTDSVFLSYNQALTQKNITLVKDGKITKEAHEYIKNIGDYVNQEINEWARRELKSIDPRYFFKREKICDVALLSRKKHYILHILDKEGVVTDEFEYKGIEIATSKISKEVKELIKNVVENAILFNDRMKANNLFQDGYQNFCNFTPEMIATRKKVNNYEKYSDIVGDDFIKGTPGHVRAAINYNKLLKELDLESKYSDITSGSKIKTIYCEKNKYGYNIIAFGDQYPKEMNQVVKPDYKMMFNKNVIPLLTRIFSIIGWPTPTVGCQEVVDLIELLS
jgi:DNA polymerase elongation subunit (family B)